MQTPSQPAVQPEEQLRFIEELKRQWMATIDALVDPLLIVNKDYEIRRTNQAMVKATEKSDVRQLIGKKCHEVFAGSKTPCKGCKMQEAATTCESKHFSLAHVRGDRFFEVSSQPIIDNKGQIEGVVQVYRDRTEAKRMQEQLMQSEKLASIGLLAGGVAHEINNPLGGILVFSQMLLREVNKKSPHYQDIVEIEAAAQRCKKIVQDLLDFARKAPDGGHGETKVELVDCIEAARSALRFAMVSLKWRTIQIEEQFADGSFKVNGDRNKIMQVFLNLIQNAGQAMPDGGTIYLRSRRGRNGTQRTVIFEVEDTGIGIPPANLKKVFDPFFTTKDPGEGTGLGLSICYSIISDMGGNLEVSSEVNNGTMFRITLPDTEHAVKAV